MKALHELADSLLPPRLVALTLVVLALGAASCGGSPVSSAPDIAPQLADEILSDVVTALEGVRSYQIEGDEVDEDGPSRLSGDVDASGSMRLSVAAGRKRARMVVVDSTSPQLDRHCPLRVLQTGPQRPGTPDRSCGDDEPSTTTAADMRLSAFNEPIHIRAPAGALDLAQLAGASGALA